MKAARRRSANHAFLNGPDVYDCFALPAKLLNTFGDFAASGCCRCSACWTNQSDTL